jgi:hypothetical protein
VITFLDGKKIWPEVKIALDKFKENKKQRISSYFTRVSKFRKDDVKEPELVGKKFIKQNDLIKLENNENLVSKVRELKFLNTSQSPVSISPFLHYKKSKFFSNNKITILMFRRKLKKSPYLELRHQRNTDVMFDLYCESSKNHISDLLKQRLYDVVETLLPTSLNGNLQLIELFAENSITTPRKGWLQVIEQNE